MTACLVRSGIYTLSSIEAAAGVAARSAGVSRLISLVLPLRRQTGSGSAKPSLPASYNRSTRHPRASAGNASAEGASGNTRHTACHSDCPDPSGRASHCATIIYLTAGKFVGPSAGDRKSVV